MLLRHLLGYLPAIVVPAVVSFVSVFAYTRLVSPADYGVYSLTVSVSLLCQAVGFYWLQLGATRFCARAEFDGQLTLLRATLAKAFIVCSLLVSAIYAVTLVVWPLEPDLRACLWFGIPLLLGRSFVSLSQAFNRGAQKALRYNLTECCQSLLGLGLGIALLRLGHQGGRSILLGLALGALLTAALDLPALRRGLRHAWDLPMLRTLLGYGLPLTACYALGFLLNTVDRLMVDYFLGPAAVGIYAVAYNVTDRSLASVFMAVSLAAFPLVVRTLESQGVGAARQQMTVNGVALLGCALPAGIGLVAAGPQFAAVLIGPAFRAEALQIMPWIVLAALMSGLQVHYFDQAFHLGNRTRLLMWNVAPAVLVNVVLNLLLLPRLGLMGAVWSALAAYATALGASVLVGRRVFAIAFPFAEMLRILVACLVMALVIRRLDLPLNGNGLLAAIGLGAVVYAVMCTALNVAGSRRMLMGRLLPDRKRYE